MATFEKRGKFWRVKVRRGAAPAQTRTFDSKSLAQQIARTVEGEIDNRVLVDRRAAERTALAQVLKRYCCEVTPLSTVLQTRTRVVLRRANHRFLREAERGVAVKDLCRRHGFSEVRYYLWRSKFGGMDVSDAKRLKALEAESPGSANEVWSMDFVLDRIASGRTIKCLVIVDDAMHEPVAVVAEHSIGGNQMVRALDRIFSLRGRRAVIRSDNGPEFSGKVILNWAHRNSILLCPIDPGKPNQNAYVE